MSAQQKNWLQLYVDAMMEKDPFKRLRLVRELHGLPKEDNSGESQEHPAIRPMRKGKRARRRQA